MRLPLLVPFGPHAITTLISLRFEAVFAAELRPNESAYGVDQSAIRDLQFTSGVRGFMPRIARKTLRRRTLLNVHSALHSPGPRERRKVARLCRGHLLFAMTLTNVTMGRKETSDGFSCCRGNYTIRKTLAEKGKLKLSCSWRWCQFLGEFLCS